MAPQNSIFVTSRYFRLPTFLGRTVFFFFISQLMTNEPWIHMEQPILTRRAGTPMCAYMRGVYHTHTLAHGPKTAICVCVPRFSPPSARLSLHVIFETPSDDIALTNLYLLRKQSAATKIESLTGDYSVIDLNVVWMIPVTHGL